MPVVSETTPVQSLSNGRHVNVLAWALEWYGEVTLDCDRAGKVEILMGQALSPSTFSATIRSWLIAFDRTRPGECFQGESQKNGRDGANLPGVTSVTKPFVLSRFSRSDRGSMRRPSFLVSTLVSLTSSIALAQEPDPTAPQGEESPKAQEEETQEPPEIGEVVVTPGRRSQALRFAPNYVTQVDAERARRQGARSTPEFLRDEPGVMVQQTNLGGGSPFVRGLTGNQILILIDGIRLNSATTRFGPNQAFNTIDPAIVDRIEVSRGLGSVLYGSDAIGGVIQVFTKDEPILREQNTFGGGLYTRFSTAEHSRTATADLGFRVSENWDVLLIGSWKRYGDVYGGADRGNQEFTGYGEWDTAFTARQKLGDDQRLRYSVQWTEQNDVPRTDTLYVDRNPNTVPDALRNFRLQRRELYAIHFEDFGVSGIADSVRASLSLHRHKEVRERTRQSGPPPFTPRDELRIEKDVTESYGATLVFDKGLDGISDERHELTYGMDVYLDHVNSRRNDITRSTGTVTPNIGAFADGAMFVSFGAFVQDEIQVTDDWSVTPGVRFSVFHTKADIEDAQGGPDDKLRNTFTTATWGVSTRYQIDPALQGIASLATGFRAPNLDDSTIAGGFSLGTEIPNSNLDPEESLTAEVGMRYDQSGVRAQLFGFRTSLRDLIQRVLTAPGSTVFQRQNVGNAYVGGIEGGVAVDLDHGFELHGSAAWTLGRIFSDQDPRQDDVPMRRIPPLMGRVGVRYEEPENGRFGGGVNFRFADSQERLHPDDIIDNRIGPNGTRGYGVIDLSFFYRLDERATLYLNLDNVADVDYRIHGSGYNGPGRNLIVGLELRL